MTEPLPHTASQSDPLPYATPSPLAAHGDLFRDGPVLVVRDNITLPATCILCAEAADTPPLHLKFTWDPSFKVSQRSTLELRRAASIHAHLCPLHLRRWKNGRIAGALGMLWSAAVMFASLVIAIISESSDVPRYAPHAIAGLIVGFALLIAFLFLFTLRTRTLKCQRIEQGYLYLEGVDESFLAQLPDLPAAAAPPAS